MLQYSPLASRVITWSFEPRIEPATNWKLSPRYCRVETPSLTQAKPGYAFTGPTGDQQKRTSLVDNHAYVGPTGGSTETLLGILPESRELDCESEQKRTSLVDHHDSYAGSPGDQQKRTSLVEHHSGIVVKNNREQGYETKNEI